MKDIITTDIDGVVLNWASNLAFFAAEYNLSTDEVLKLMVDEKFRKASEIFNCTEETGDEIIKMYNRSKWIRGLKAYDDALIHINKMKDKYDFVAITAIGTDFQTSMNRMSNLNVLFPGAFKEILICDCHESKIDLFKRVNAKYGERVQCYVDDLSHHCRDFYKVFDNKECFRMVRGENESKIDDEYAGIIPVRDWAGVFNRLKDIENAKTTDIPF